MSTKPPSPADQRTDRSRTPTEGSKRFVLNESAAIDRGADAVGELATFFLIGVPVVAVYYYDDRQKYAAKAKAALQKQVGRWVGRSSVVGLCGDNRRCTYRNTFESFICTPGRWCVWYMYWNNVPCMYGTRMDGWMDGLSINTIYMCCSNKLLYFAHESSKRSAADVQ